MSLAAVNISALDLKPMSMQLLLDSLLRSYTISCRSKSRSIPDGFRSAAAYIVCVFLVSFLLTLPVVLAQEVVLTFAFFF